MNHNTNHQTRDFFNRWDIRLLSRTSWKVGVLRFELMINVVCFAAATSIKREAQHEVLCRIGRLGERDLSVYRG